MKVCVLVFQLHVQLCKKFNIYKKVKCQAKRRAYYQFHIFITSDHCLAKINGSIHNRLLLFSVQDSCKFQITKQLLAIKNKGKTIGTTCYNFYMKQALQTWYNGLSCDSVSPVVYHCCTQGVQTFRIQVKVGLHTLQVIALKNNPFHSFKLPCTSTNTLQQVEH